MTRTQVGKLLADQRRNAAVGWLLCAFLVAMVAAHLLEGDLVWAGFVVGVLALALVPPVAYRNPGVMLPWEVLALAALPLIGQALATWWLTTRLATYLAVTAVALIVAVELHVFTTVRMSYGFAILFVVVTTMAAAGVWALARWSVELFLGIDALYPGQDDPHELVMWEFVYSTVAGLVAGVSFETYFRRRAHVEERIPEEILDEVGDFL